MPATKKKNQKNVKRQRVTNRRTPIKTKPAKKATGLTTTHNIFILDSSGSMGCVQEVTRQGFNEQVQTIKKLAKEGTLKQTATFYTFSDESTEKFCNLPAADVKELGPSDYIPNGNTALNDCIGRAIETARKDYADSKDTTVVITILTDGQENASKKYTTSQIGDLLKEVQEKYKWTVTYIGANQDVHLAARNYSIPLSNMASYTSTGAGTTAAFAKMAKSRACYSNKMADYAAKGLSAQTVDNTKFYNSVEAALSINEDGSETTLDNSKVTLTNTTLSYSNASDIHTNVRGPIKRTGKI